MFSFCRAAKAVAEATSQLVNAAKAVEAKRNEPQAVAEGSGTYLLYL
jgi:hypothetical protein